MNHYRMQLWSSTLADWQHDFMQPSDRLAVEYAGRHVLTLAALEPRVTSILLWRILDKDGDGFMLGQFHFHLTVKYTEVSPPKVEASAKS